MAAFFRKQSSLSTVSTKTGDSGRESKKRFSFNFRQRSFAHEQNTQFVKNPESSEIVNFTIMAQGERPLLKKRLSSFQKLKQFSFKSKKNRLLKHAESDPVVAPSAIGNADPIELKQPVQTATGFVSRTILDKELISELEVKAWDEFCSEYATSLASAQEEIKFSFNVKHLKKGIENMPAYPGCSMNQIFDTHLAGKEVLDNVTLTAAEIPQTDQHFAYGDPRYFRVRRGPDYKKNKQKAPSGLAIYDLISVDSFETPNKIYNFGDFVDFPQRSGDHFLPEYLVVNIMIPCYKPLNPLFHERLKDGRGVNVVQIFRFSDWARCNKNDPSVVLLKKFMLAAAEYTQTSNPKLRELVNRLKNIISVLNPQDLGFGAIETKLFPKYNKTPWLIRYFLTNYKMGHNWFEIDVDYHNFKYTTLQLGHMIFNKVSKAVVDSSLVIEAKKNSEMPERVLCNIRVFYLDMDGSPVIDMESLVKNNPAFHRVKSQLEESLEKRIKASVLDKVEFVEDVIVDDMKTYSYVFAAVVVLFVALFLGYLYIIS